MSPQRQLYLSPCEVNVGMMVPVLGQFPNTVRKIERGAEVLELEFPFQVMLVNDAPSLAQLPGQIPQLISLQRLNATFAGHTFLLR